MTGRHLRGGPVIVLGLAIVFLASCGTGSPSASDAGSVRRVTASAVPAAPSTGCDSAEESAVPTTQTLSLSSDGLSGTYIQDVPAGHVGHPLPLIVDLHGYAEPAAVQATVSTWNTFADTHGLVAVTPQITRPVQLWDTALGSHDLAWFSSLLTTVESDLCIDRNRVYVDGYSDGAFMASAIACQLADRVAAVAPVAGLQAPARCKPARPVPVIAFHGTADPFVSYQGGLGQKALDLPAPDGSHRTLGQSGSGTSTTGPSIPQQTTTWARRNGCSSQPMDTIVASDVTLVRYHCPPGAEVELYRVTGGGHAWPGSTFTRSISSVVGRTTFSISADDLMWAFFLSHPLTTTTTTTTTTK
jgi:polyhydroxybutyrate depolymerase